MGTTLTTVSSSCATAGANTGVAASAGNHHVLCGFQLQMEATATSLQRVLLKSGTTEMWRLFGTAVGDGLTHTFEQGEELHWGSGHAIVLDLAEAKAVGYVLRYRTFAD